MLPKMRPMRPRRRAHRRPRLPKVRPIGIKIEIPIQTAIQTSRRAAAGGNRTGNSPKEVLYPLDTAGAPDSQTRTGLFHVGGRAGERKAHKTIALEGIEVGARRRRDAGL